jgi:hypothetical protein
MTSNRPTDEETLARLRKERRAMIAPVNYEGKTLPKRKSAYMKELEKKVRAQRKG